MASYVYKGLTQAEQKARYDAMRSGIHPQDKRGEEARYGISHTDSEAVKEQKRKAAQEWVKAREKEIKAKLEKLASECSIGGVTFPAGKAVKVEDGSALDQKLAGMVKAKGSHFVVADAKPEKAKDKE